MNSMLRKVLVCAAAATALAFSTQVQAGYWSESSGTAPSGHFTYSDGHDLNGSFGDPYITLDDRFIFDYALIGVSAPPGGHDLKSDSVLFDLHVIPGFTLTGLEVRVYGDYLVQGAGSKVDLTAGLRVEEFAGQPAPPALPRVFEDELTTTPVLFPIESLGETLQGTYAGIATVSMGAVMPAADDDLHISCSNLLEAWAAANGVANLNLFYQQLRFEIVLIPEPCTLLLAALGGIALLRRR